MTIEDLARQVRSRDRDRWLAALYAPVAVRPALLALWALDLELGEIVLAARDAMVAEIKLAWWRDALIRLDSAPPPGQPLLQALAAEVLPRGVSGAALATLEDRWLPVLSAATTADHAAGGATLFGLAARLLSPSPAQAEPVDALGAAWAAGDALRRGSGDGAPEIAALPRVPSGLRPLLGLAKLGRRDARRAAAGQPPEPRGTLPRQWLLLKAVALGR